MKRTRFNTKAKSGNEGIPVKDTSKDETGMESKDNKYHLEVQAKNLLNEKLNNSLAMLQTQSEVIDTAKSSSTSSSEDVKASDKSGESKLNLKSLKDRNKRVNEELKPNTRPAKNKPRAVVDLEMMKEELKQLEDPPLSTWEKEICSNRLPFSFFDSPCEDLAQNLLGKVLVRYLENGTILKGRIVETEGYLGVVDKASHTYQNKITPRNIPMYMPPGTIYVYMTYGMYHCFNISSQVISW
ncbi:DNA-3-methyladenine glycosylase-like isoform X4 [Hylaeus anthracinus]|uniref:DNA-3-methyladenine glycosylase-like isoform X4 n=1 Tax=Hylaeus anthracinus TaxID=313031 RepID=UPI0023B92ACA|nr:DNA-3-methyladenine glycosylase-like isoform X4 [Hylaeus anthracinus]